MMEDFPDVFLASNQISQTVVLSQDVILPDPKQVALVPEPGPTSNAALAQNKLLISNIKNLNAANVNVQQTLGVYVASVYSSFCRLDCSSVADIVLFMFVPGVFFNSDFVNWSLILCCLLYDAMPEENFLSVKYKLNSSRSVATAKQPPFKDCLES